MIEVRRIVIAQWGRVYAEAIQAVCLQVFTKASAVSFCSGREVLVGLRDQNADLLLLGMTFPDLDGVDLLRVVADEKLARKVLVISHRKEEHSQLALRDARFDGLIDALDEGVESLITALHLIANNGVYVSQSFRSQIIDRDPMGVLSQRLTSAEIKAFSAIGDGSSNEEASIRLGISEATVQTHRRNIMNKLGISSSAKLVREAIRLGVVRITVEGKVIRPGFEAIAPVEKFMQADGI